jgi:flavorubredoxin
MIDLVRDWNDAPQAIEKQLDSIGLRFQDIDYLIMNHLEPDHTGWLRGLVQRNPRVKILTSKKGKEMTKNFYGMDDNVDVVGSGDSLDLGGKQLVFEEAPNVHWPETMVSYDPDTGVLFSCDAFGSFGKLGNSVFDDEISAEEHEFFERESLRYYANIVASFSVFVQRAIKKLAGLTINVIGPSHGIIWRENPGTIIDRYQLYASYMNGPAEPEVTVVWGSMYGNTQAMLNSVVQGIRSQKVPVHVHRVPNEDVSYPLASAWKSAGMVIGMPTYEYKMFPPMAYVLDVFERKHVWNKKAFRFGSFGWSGGAQKEFDTKTEKLKWDFMEPVEFQGMPEEADLAIARERGSDLAKAVKQMAGKE